MNAVTKIRQDEPVPSTGPHVISAIANVMAEMSQEGIAKEGRNASQGYNYRGIDQVFNALAPVLSRNGLVILPRVTSRECVERSTAKGTAIFYVTCAVEFTLASAQDGSSIVVSTYGEAMDSADKATNKAMSAAYKYMALQTFCIPTEGDNDADATHHDVEPKTPLWVTAAKAAIECLNTEDECGAWYKQNLDMLKSHPQAERDDVLAKLKARKEAVKPLPVQTYASATRGAPAAGVAATLDDEIPF